MADATEAPDAGQTNAVAASSPWRRPVFRRVLVGESLSQLGAGFTLIGLPLLVLQLTHSAAWLGATGIAFAVPAVAGGLLGTALADRFSRRTLLLASGAGQLLVTALLPLSLLLAADRAAAMALVLGCAVLLGALGTAFQIAFNAVVPRLVPAGELARANAIVIGAESVALLCGPALAGLVLAVGGIAWVFEVDAATYLASIAGVIGAGAALAGRGTAGPLMAAAREGVRLVWRATRLRWLTALGFLAYLGTGSFMALLVYRLTYELHEGAPVIGIAVTAASAGGVLGSVLATRLVPRGVTRRASRAAEGRLIVASLVCVGLVFLGMAAAATAPAYAALGAAEEAFAAVANVGALSLTQRLVPDMMLGRVMSIAYTLGWAGTLLSQALMGVLTALGGARASFLVFGAELVAGGGIVALSPFATGRGRPGLDVPADAVLAPGGRASAS